MRERINRLAKGHIDYGEVEAAFSETKIEDTVLLDEKKREEFRVVCTRGKSVKGLVYSTNQRVSLFSGNFVGKDCRIIYEVDASYAEGDIEGEFQIVCSAGEFRIPYRFRVCAVSGENGASTLEEFAAMARENGEEALRFFESADFRKCPFMEDAGLRTLYESVWEEPFFYNCSSTVMVHIRKLRLKVEEDPQKPKRIVTVWGKGYRFDPVLE